MSALELSDLCDKTADSVLSLRSSVLFPTETSVVLDRFWRLQDHTYRLVAYVHDNDVDEADRKTRVRVVLGSIVEVMDAADKFPVRKLGAVARASANIQRSLRALEKLVAS